MDALLGSGLMGKNHNQVWITTKEGRVNV